MRLSFPNRRTALLACAAATLPFLSAPSQAAPSYAVIYSFSGGADGAMPQAPLLLDHGNLIGTTYAGGTANLGTVFSLTPSGAEAVLHSFAGAPTDGQNPRAGITRGDGVVGSGHGLLFGTTSAGGKSGAGTVFALSLRKQTEFVIYNFAGGGDGSDPWGELLNDGQGNLYGTTFNNGQGTVFRIFEGTQAEAVVHGFGSLKADGSGPVGQLVRDAQGNIYGATNGSTPDSGGYGALYKLAPNEGFSLLHAFTGYSRTGDGAAPQGGPIMDSAGNLYGTTYDGGNDDHFGSGDGVVYKLAPDGTETILHTFGGTPDGAQPTGSLLLRDGHLFGTTLQGGADNQGSIFEISPDGREEVLHSFTNGADGGWPYAGLTRGADGTLYGTASKGGASGAGVVFAITP
jgi:uncharacterized repeat protein (TIGR03803 family)